MSSTTAAPPLTVRHGDTLRLPESLRQQVVTLSGYGARYRDYDGPEGPARYARVAQRSRQTFPGGPEHRRHNGVVWLTALPVIIAAVEHHAAMAAERARDITVDWGQVIRVASPTPGEGGLYRVERPGRGDGDHARLIPVTADGEEAWPQTSTEA